MKANDNRIIKDDLGYYYLRSDINRKCRKERIILSIRRRKIYKIWQSEVFKRDNYVCRECGAKNKQLHAHHIKSFYLNVDLRFNVDNGITLCLNCHAKKPKQRVAA